MVNKKPKDAHVRVFKVVEVCHLDFEDLEGFFISAEGKNQLLDHAIALANKGELKFKPYKGSPYLAVIDHATTLTLASDKVDRFKERSNPDAQ